MNSIAKQLRSGDFTSYEILKAADLIESQEQRIKELEDQVNAERDAKYALQDKLAALRQRIKELEAELRDYKDAADAESKEVNRLNAALVDLRQRIDDAPVVAHYASGRFEALISKEDLQK